MDKDRIKHAVSELLLALGEDPERPGLKETPERIANMCEGIFAGYDTDPGEHLGKVFPVDEPGTVIESGIPFYSMCEHHLLPFFGTVTIAYAHRDKVVGLSKLARTVEVYARRLQIQEQMTRQIGQAVMKELDADGVMVVVKAEHMCMSMRGIKKPGVLTTTVFSDGCFKDDNELCDRLLRLC